ncbi:MAG: hypothetical protein IT180_14765 [Acidobacteria bacterium]|nr:hypothetical protein [Acidobacteriota bacterium]
MRLVLALLLSLAAPRPSCAWGFEAHRLIADRVIDLLPAALKPLFEEHRAFIVERSIDPDLWRTAGFESEPPNHFLDMDHRAFGPYPFEGLPRSYDEAVQKFGRAFIQDQGLLPWRVPEFYGLLQRGFASLKRPSPSPYALDDIVYYVALLSHYVADGHVPLHAVVNYDGQLTGQQGVHGRWETQLFERNRGSISVNPAAPHAVTEPRTFMFDVLLASNRMAADVLAADKAAAAGRDFYDDAYFAAFGVRALPGLEQRLNASVTAVAGLIIGAWEQAGRPDVPTSLSRTPRPVRRP